ncbi:MAG: hypothetical protein LBC74_05565 [Planctomycetaceae bacterium]|nr:hypothetical protein [Planctomycetaceae bacterium]
MAANNDRIQKIQYLVKKGDWKKAYKEAKFSATLSNSPEIKSLAITSLWNWIKDQVKHKQYEDAKLNIRELIHVGVNTIPHNIRNEFPPVFLLLGLNSMLPEDLKNDTNSKNIQIQLIDQYIIHNINSTDILPEILANAAQVKEAFKLIESRQDTKAIEILASIPFNSPVSEWRLLLRGLIAHYDGDNKTANENWQRLSNSRPTKKIAENLQKLFNDKNKSKTNEDIVRQFNFFNDRSGSEQSQKIDLIDNLRIVGDCMKLQKYKEILVRLPIIRQTAAKQNAFMYGRILRLLHIHLLENAQPTIIRQFVEQNLPLPLDPHGNRTFALLFDRLINCHDTIPNWLRHAGMNPLWNKFAEEDVDQIESFSPPMKARAKSIAFCNAVKSRKMFIEKYGNLIIDDFDDAHELLELCSQKNTDWFMCYFDKSLITDPSNIQAFEAFEFFLQSLIEFKENPELYEAKLDELHQLIVEHNQDDIKILNQEFDRCFDKSDFDKAAEYLNLIEKINPLSKNAFYRKLKITQQQCKLALQDGDLLNVKKFLAVLKNIPTPESLSYRHNIVMLAFKFIYYILSDKPKHARKVLLSCKNYGIDKPLPIIITVLCSHIKIPKQVTQKLELQLSKKNNEKINSSVIAAICDSLSGLSDRTPINKSNMTLSPIVAATVRNYLNNVTKIKWKKEKDIVCVCTFLWSLNLDGNYAFLDDKYNCESIFIRLVKKGKKLFSNSLELNFLMLEAKRIKYNNLFSRQVSQQNIDFRFAQKKIRQLNKQYSKFLNNCGKMKDNPELKIMIHVAEKRSICSIPNVLKAMLLHDIEKFKPFPY